MISYNAIKRNSRLTQFNGTKELVIRNAIPQVKCEKQGDNSVQSCLFQF
jgi:hypothetical protein